MNFLFRNLHRIPEIKILMIVILRRECYIICPVFLKMDFSGEVIIFLIGENNEHV